MVHEVECVEVELDEVELESVDPEEELVVVSDCVVVVVVEMSVSAQMI